jgi:hypothetical protein
MNGINNDNRINRGIDLILNGGKRKQPKTFHIILDKVVCFLKREVTIYFEFSLNIRKKK